MKEKKFYPINSELSLAEISITPTTTNVVATNKHVIYVVDVSGSMYSELPKLRENFKNKIATSLNQGDMLSIVYYSSNGDYGFILKGYQYSGIDGLNQAQKAIDLLDDRYLTGFVDPLNAVTDFIKNENSSMPVTVVFMSDGYENQNSKSKVLEATKALADVVDHSVVVEYGQYANHGLLMDMSDALGGSFVYAKDFSAYNMEALNVLTKEISGKKIEVEIPNGKYVYSFDGQSVTLYTSNGDGVYLVPENVNEIFAVVEETHRLYDNSTDQAYFPLLYTCVLKGDSKLAWDCLEKMGDVNLIDKFSGAIGKVKILEFLDYVKSSFNDNSLRYAKGKNLSYLPKEDAYCVFQLLQDLSINDNYLITTHPEFSYKRIGRKRIEKKVELSEEFKQKIQNVTSKEEVLDLLSKEPDSVEKLIFTQTHIISNKFENLVFNTDRANISLRCTFAGFVNLPKNLHNISVVNTYIHRNYTILKDGVLNTPVLPVKLSQKTFNVLKSNDLVDGDYDANKIYVLNIENLPTINRKMIKSLSVLNYVKNNYELEKLKGQLKVVNSYANEFAPKTSDTFTAMWGQEGAEYLKSLGITEYNGFNPPSSYAESTDFYYSPIIGVKFKGQSLPSLNDLIKRISDNKALSLGASWMKIAYDEIMDFQNSDDYLNAADKDGLFKIWLEKKKTSLTNQKRNFESYIAKTVFSKLLSQTEWEDFALLNDNQITLQEDGFDIIATIEEKEEEVKI